MNTLKVYGIVTITGLLVLLHGKSTLLVYLFPRAARKKNLKKSDRPEARMRGD